MTPMPDHEAALWTGELGPGYAGPVSATTLRAQLRAAIAADPRSEAQIARDAGMEPAALSRLLREDKPRDGALSTWERVASALGLRVALVPDKPTG